MNRIEEIWGLPIGSLVELTPNPEKIPFVEYQLEGKGEMETQNNRKGQLVPRGGKYQVLMLSDSSLLMDRGDAVYLFSERIAIPEETSASEFFHHVKVFCDNNQVPGSYSFEWQTMKLKILDVGHLIYHYEDGDSYLPNETEIRYILCEMDDGRIFYLEDCRHTTDGYRLGYRMLPDLNQCLGQMTKK